MSDFPRTLYRGSFADQAALEAAWNSQNGIEQKHVATVQEQLAALKLGFVEHPSEMIKSPTAASMIGPRKGAKVDEPLNGDS